MSLWNKIFKKKKQQVPVSKPTATPPQTKKTPAVKDIKKMFLLGWEVKFTGDQQCESFLTMQRSTEANARNASSGIELIFENNKLTKAFNYDEGYRVEKDLKEEEIGLEYKDYPINPILQFFDNIDGLHQLGGELPESVSFPENNCAVPFQYIGYISDEDENFKWLPGTIHLMCPIYLNIDKVFLDYSDPQKPTIINREEVDNSENPYDKDLNKDSKIVYESKKFDLVSFDEFDLPLHSGVPNWIQYPTFPICPKSGKVMQFLCQINGGVNTAFSNVTPHNEFYKRYYDKLNFWGDGDLYVFIEPTERTVCYFIQNT